MTELVEKYKLRERAKDTKYFSPLRGRRVWGFGDPAVRDEIRSASARCPVIHWWQWRFRAAELPRDVLPPKDSFLAELFLKHGGQVSRISILRYIVISPITKGPGAAHRLSLATETKL